MATPKRTAGACTVSRLHSGCRQDRAVMRCLVFCMMSVYASAATYNAYQYDMTTPQFTPDGRVLQVEYASAAASHSSCVVVAPIPNGNDNDNDTVILLTTRPARTVQERLVVLSDSHTVVALSGILTDSLALLQKVQDETLSNRRWYGRGLACHQVSETIRSACQRHAFGGGLRPYGSTIVVCGVLEGSGHIQTQRTDPSGSLQDIDVVSGLQVVGGPVDGALRKEIMRQQQNNSWQPKDVAQGIVQMTRQILEADRKERAIKRQSGATDEDPIVEVVVVSATRGVYKLSPSQLRALLDKSKTA